MTIVLGTCTACGNEQPGEAGAAVALLSGEGCAKCGNEEFVVPSEKWFPDRR
ncbi:hypothetical protein G9464_05410 [Halostella sp. JP-L12]|uniref:hypothetical protein n=1 Tax=Halostella TaxID=1843185 RepID=UPI0013CEF10D|nr:MULTISPECIES: hypothetical protein [Halostella]NHN47034.1 hypothetical protein [Halostella sp. JP-L12]